MTDHADHRRLSLDFRLPANGRAITPWSIAILALLFVLSPAAYAFTSCKVTQLSGPGGALPEEELDPVVEPHGGAFAAYVDGGTTLDLTEIDPTGNVTNTTRIDAGSGRVSQPRLALSGTEVFAAWVESVNRKPILMFRRSPDHGRSWEDSTAIGPVYGTPQIAAAGANVYLAYLSPFRAPMLVVSRDYGQTFVTPIALESGASSREIAMVAAGENLVVAWVFSTGTSKNTRIVKTAVSHDSGQTLTISYETDTASSAVEPLLAITNDVAFMVWRQDAGVTRGAFFTTLTRGALSFRAPRQIASEPHVRKFSVAADGANVAIVYLQQIGTTSWYVMLQRSTDGGRTLTGPRKLSGDLGLSGGVLPDQVHVPQAWVWGAHMSFAWSDARNVYVQSSNDSGRHISAPLPLGQGDFQLIARRNVLWTDPNGVVEYAHCEGG